MAPPERSFSGMIKYKKNLLIPIVAFSLLHYLVLISLAGIIFLASHVPPKAAHLDGLILVLFQAESVLSAPRKFLLWLAPGETTPVLLSLSTAVLNSLIWGIALAAGRSLWVKIRS